MILLAVLFQSNLFAQYYLNNLANPIVLIESSSEKGQGILVTSNEPYLGQIILISSLSTFTKEHESPTSTNNLEFIDELVSVSHYFRKNEKDYLTEYAKECGEDRPLKIQFNFKTLVDSTNCVTFLDSSDAVAIKLYDNKNSIDKRFVSFDGICALRPLIHDSSIKNELNTNQNLTKEVYLFSEHSEESTRIYLMDIDIRKDSQGKKIIPLIGTNYVSRVLFKVKNDWVSFYGIANKEQEIFEINISSILKNRM